MYVCCGFCCGQVPSRQRFAARSLITTSFNILQYSLKKTLRTKSFERKSFEEKSFERKSFEEKEEALSERLWGKGLWRERFEEKALRKELWGYTLGRRLWGERFEEKWEALNKKLWGREFAYAHMLKAFPSVPCLRPAEMGKSAEQMYRQLPCLSAHAMELWVHIIRLLRNQKAPTRRGGRKHNRHSLELSKSQKLSDSDYIAIEVQAFLSDVLPSFSELFATRNVQVCE